MIAAVADRPVWLGVTVCDGDAPAVTIDEGKHRTHRTWLKTWETDRHARPYPSSEFTALGPVEDLRLVEERADHPEADAPTRWSLRGRRHDDARI